MQNTKRNLIALNGCFLLLCITLTSRASVLQAPYQQVAITGDVVPGEGPGVVIADFLAPVINNAGVVVFGGVLGGPGITRDNDGAVFHGGNGPLNLLVREGLQAAGAEPGVAYSNISHFRILDNSGTTAIGSTLGGAVSPGDDSALYLINGASAADLVRKGDPLPGEGPGYIVSGVDLFNNLSMNQSGQAVFVGQFFASATSKGDAIYTGTPGAIEVVARQGALAPDGAVGLRFGSLNFIRNANINNGGEVAFVANLTGTGVTSGNDRGVYYYDPVSDTLAKIARKGDQVPGATAGITFQNIGNPAISDSGRVLFGALLSGPGIDTTNNNAFYLASPTSSSEIARTGQQAPGVAAGIVYSELSVPSVNASEQAAFRDMLTGPGVDTSNESVIILTGSVGPSLIARGGMQVPDADPGVTVFRLSNPALNASGQVAFIASLAGAGVDSTNDSALYATDRVGNLVEIVRSGTTIDISDDPLIVDLRVVATIEAYMPGDSSYGLGSGLNDIGQVAFTVGFTDHSRGTFISNRATVPEPGASISLGVSACLLIRRRRG